MTVRLAIVFASLSLLWVTSGEVLGSEVALDEFEDNTGRYTIEGKVYSPELFSLESNWQKDTVVSINDGEFNGFLREDGTFVISNVPSGSYVVDIVNPDYLYESVSVHDKITFCIFYLKWVFYYSIAWRSIPKVNSALAFSIMFSHRR